MVDPHHRFPADAGGGRACRSRSGGTRPTRPKAQGGCPVGPGGACGSGVVRHSVHSAGCAPGSRAALRGGGPYPATGVERRVPTIAAATRSSESSETPPPTSCWCSSQDDGGSRRWRRSSRCSRTPSANHRRTPGACCCTTGCRWSSPKSASSKIQRFRQCARAFGRGRARSSGFMVSTPRPPRPGDDTGERDAELMTVAREVARRGAPAIVAGDLNDVGWSRTSRRMRAVGGLGDPRIGRGLLATFDCEPADRAALAGRSRLRHNALPRVRTGAAGLRRFGPLPVVRRRGTPVRPPVRQRPR